jgi:hypothetical protein
MKKIISLLLIVSFFLSITSTNAQTAVSKTKNFITNADGSLTGAWVSTDHKQFAIMNDGFFSSIGQDSTGMWKDMHAGTYTIDNANTITYKVLYSSFPDHVGAFHTAEYEIKGETLTIKWFKKLIDATGTDITAQMPKGTQTQFVKAKK